MGQHIHMVVKQCVREMCVGWDLDKEEVGCGFRMGSI